MKSDNMLFIVWQSTISGTKTYLIRGLTPEQQHLALKAHNKYYNVDDDEEEIKQALDFVSGLVVNEEDANRVEWEGWFKIGVPHAGAHIIVTGVVE